MFPRDLMNDSTEEALRRLFAPSPAQQWLGSERTTRLLQQFKDEDARQKLIDSQENPS